VNELLFSNKIFSFCHLYLPPELNFWVKAETFQDNNHNLRSNGRGLIVPVISKINFGDLRLRNIFSNYVNFH
jgi:hypothetical protein